MPLALDPDSTFPLTLKHDEGKPNAPTYLCPFLTGRQRRRVGDIVKASAELFDAGDLDAADAKVNEALPIVLRGWRNINRDGKPIPFTIEEAADVLTFGERFNICATAPVKATLRSLDPFTFASPSEFPSAASAPTVGTGEAANV